MPMTYGPAVGGASVKFEDFNGQPSAFTLPAGDATKLKAGLELFNAISNATITGIVSTSTEPVTAGANVSVFGGQREYLMVLETILADGKTVEWELPAPKEVILFSGDKTLLNMLNADLIAFIGWATTAGNGVKLTGKGGLKSQISLITRGWVFHKASKTQTKKQRRG